MDLMLIVFFVSLLIVVTGALYKKLQDVSLAEPFLALAAGILVGPDVLNLITSADQGQEFKVLKTACEFTIAMALMATALRLPDRFFRQNASSLSTLVLAGMLLMWLSSAAVLYWVLPSLSFVECLLLGAIVAPTDPVVASTLITGEKARKFLPSSIRSTLSFEAGANDGLAFPLVLLSVFLVGSADFTLNEWFTRILVYENILCGILAYGIGSGAGFIMKNAHKAGWMSDKTLLPFSIALALLLLSGFNALGMNGIVAVFIGGVAYARDITRNEEIEEEKVQESMERITTTPVFFILGLMLPWSEWFSMGWTALVVVVLVLLFRRIPVFLALMPVLPKFRKKPYSILVMGWFGPIGVAALYYAVLSQEKTDLKEAWVIPSLIVVASTVLHGLTSVPLEKLYHKRNEGKKQEKEQGN